MNPKLFPVGYEPDRRKERDEKVMEIYFAD